MTNSEVIVAVTEKLMQAIIETGSVKLGFDKIMGEGAYERLAGDLYDALREKAAAK